MSSEKPLLSVNSSKVIRTFVSDKVLIGCARGLAAAVPERAADDLLDFSVVYIDTRSDPHIVSAQNVAHRVETGFPSCKEFSRFHGAFAENGYLRWSYKFYGSEGMTEAAFALRATHRYGMALGADDAHRLRFSPLNALLFELAWAAVIYGVITLAGRIRPIRRKK